MFPCKELFGVLDLDIVLGKERACELVENLRSANRWEERGEVLSAQVNFNDKVTQISPFINVFFSFTQASHNLSVLVLAAVGKRR